MGRGSVRDEASELVTDDGNETGVFRIGVIRFLAGLGWWICGGPEGVNDESIWLPNAAEVAIIPRRMVARKILLASFSFIIYLYRKACVGLDTQEEGDLRNEND